MNFLCAIRRTLAALWACDPVDNKPTNLPIPVFAIYPPPDTEWTPEAARERQDTEMSKWKKGWHGNGLPPGPPVVTGSPLHDHPHSRPATFAPCSECRFPQFGWGGWDHWPECSKYRADGW